MAAAIRQNEMETPPKENLAPAPQSSAATPPPEGLRLNLGCGTNKRPGFLNVDKFSVCEPDLVHDLESFPWPWPTNSVVEVTLSHVLEHIGHNPSVFLSFMQELYRVCRGDAVIRIIVPHPHHADFITDPTHVRPITPDLLRLFSKRRNREYKEKGYANSQLAFYTDTDFEITENIMTLDPVWKKRYEDGEYTSDQIFEIARERLNVGREFRLTVRVVKDPPE
jgi:hypothetical protein